MFRVLFAGLASLAVAAPALAGTPIPFGGTMFANWFTVQPGGSGDFQTTCCSEFRLDMVQAALGPNGLPVYNPASPGPVIKGVDPVTGELQWWTAGVTAGGDTVTATGQTIVNVPYSDLSLFPPNGDGTGNGGRNGFQTVLFTTTLLLDRTYDVTFNIRADDDAFLFVNSLFVTGLGGVHPITASPPGTVRLGAGSHDVRLFFADRHTVASGLEFSLFGVAAIPEPATWAMLIAGFGLVGVSLRRRRSTGVQHAIA